MQGLRDFLKGIWQDPFKRYLVLALAILWIILLSFQSGGEASAEGELHFFYHPTCPHCHDQMPFMEGLEERHGVTFVYHDTSNPNELALLKEMAREAGIPDARLGWPLTFVGEEHFLGFRSAETTGAEIERALERYVAGTQVNGGAEEFDSIVALPFLGEVDVLDYSLPVLAIILGLVDGFNPCAMWVLVYLISIIITVGDKRKIWLLVGSFVLASGILYFLFMTAWLNAFLLIGYVKPLTMLIGLVALGFGILNIKTFLESKGPLVCEVSDPGSRKKTMSRIDRIVRSPLTWATVGGIIVLAFLVNLIEFACSAALPAIFTQVLALSDVSTLQHYLYILLYVFFFMLDDLVIFGLAAFAVNSTFGDRYAKLCKVVGGLLLVILGLLLAFAPGILQ